MSRLVLVLLLVPASVAAHHGVDEDASTWRGTILWGGAALVFGVLALLGWISSRKRGDDETED
jgi:hypothetical protein